MNDSHADDASEVVRRLSEIESLLMFLQRTVDDLNSVILEQQRRLESHDSELERLRGMFTNLGDATAEPRKPEDEKPPHY